MGIMVQYFREINQHDEECWSFINPTEIIAEALDRAREGKDIARDYFGATSFRVLDADGYVFAVEEFGGADPNCGSV